MLEEFPLQNHPSRLSSSWKLGGGGCCSSDHTYLPHFLLMETTWALGSKHTHQHLRRGPTRRVGWMHTALCSCDLSGLGTAVLGFECTAPFSLSLVLACSHSPVLSTAGVRGALQVPTLPASISLIRTCSWMLCLGPCFFWSWINTEEMVNGVSQKPCGSHHAEEVLYM